MNPPSPWSEAQSPGPPAPETPPPAATQALAATQAPVAAITPTTAPAPTAAITPPAAPTPAATQAPVAAITPTTAPTPTAAITPATAPAPAEVPTPRDIPRPPAADGGEDPPGPPAPDDDRRTGDAGGKPPVGGGAEAAPAVSSRPRGPRPRTTGASTTRRPTRPAGAHPHNSHRTAGLLLGLAAGDAAGWPAARHRASRMPDWTRRLTRELDTFAEQNATTTLPVPIALNQPPEPLRLGPSDDAEWAAFAAEALLRAGDDTALGDLSRERRARAAIDLTWSALAAEVAAAADRAPEIESAVLPLRARISVRAGLGNLAAGLRPPASGHDNPHYFDDAACVRACVLAVAHPGDPARAAALAEFDARYTQDGDGVHGARAMAAALALALAGTDTDACVAAALAELPHTTEIGRNARHALHLAQDADSAFALVPLLEHQIVDHVYSYGIAAAETVPVALALVTAARGRITEAVPAAVCLSRVADSAPALAGALTGALGGTAAIPASWQDACRTLSGCVLPRLTGTDLVELAGLLEAAQPTPPGG